MTSNTTAELQLLNKSHPVFLQPQGLRVPKQEKEAQQGNLIQDPETAGLDGSGQSHSLEFQNKTDTS